VSSARRARLIPVIEISLAVLATALAFYFGERFSIATYLGMVSRRAHVGVDFANLGPGLFVLASGLGVVTVRRWRETITERETLSETRSVLANSEMQYRALVELSPAPMLLSNQDLVVIFANDAARRLMRASEGNRLEGHCFLDLVHPDSLARVKFRGMSVLDGQAMPSEEVRLVRLDGTGVTVQISSVPASMEGRPGASRASFRTSPTWPRSQTPCARRPSTRWRPWRDWLRCGTHIRQGTSHAWPSWPC
jgi:PAS domain S-box-containing protein